MIFIGVCANGKQADFGSVANYGMWVRILPLQLIPCRLAAGRLTLTQGTHVRIVARQLLVRKRTFGGIKGYSYLEREQ